jgi:hypothetical protein
MSAEIDEIAKALPAAQAAIAEITLDAANPHFGSRYASYAEIRAAIVPAMNAAGITVLTGLRAGDGRVEVQTMLLHTSRQWIASTHSVPVSKGDAQGVGSAATYAKRQALQALLTVAAVGEDDDGEGAVGRGQGRPPLPPAEPKRPPRLARVENAERALREVKTLVDLERAMKQAKAIRDECAEHEPALAARIDDLYRTRHEQLIAGAG